MTQDERELMKKSLDEIKRLKKLVHEKNGESEIAVIGMACRFPGGIQTPEDLWHVVSQGKCVIDAPSPCRKRENDSKSRYTQKAGYLDEDIEAFDDRLFRISPKEAACMDPQQKLVMKTCWELFENSGLMPDKQEKKEIGVFIGASQMDFANHVTMQRAADGVKDPKDITGTGLSFISGRVSYYFGLTGPSVTYDSACSSALTAVYNACEAIKRGDCCMAAAGGVNILYSNSTTELLAELGILSDTCELKAFDENANGTVRGEGCGMLMLKKLDDAIADHDCILAVVKGGSMNCDGKSSGMTSPYGPAQTALIQKALNRSSLTIDDIAYIETHGTGTKMGDLIELNALSDLKPENNTNKTYIGTVKSNIGHLEAAAGAAGLIKAVMMLRHKEIPKSAGFENMNPNSYAEKSGIAVPTKNIVVKDEKMDVGVSAFGLSGNNVHIIVENYEQTVKKEETKKDNMMLKFSSTDKTALKSQLSSFETALKGFQDANVMEMLPPFWNTSKADLNERCVYVGSNDIAKVATSIHTYLTTGFSDNFVFGNNRYEQTVFMFTGQNSQYPGMFKNLYEENKVFAAYLDECFENYREISGENLKNIIFEDPDKVNLTVYTQPGIFSVEYALAKMLMHYGIVPDMVIGHSLGEITAACIAGMFTLKDAMKLVNVRGKLMEQTPAGKMMAVNGSREAVIKALEETGCNCTVAVSNSSSQTVVSGLPKDIEKAEEVLSSKFRTRLLKNSHPFHSKYMENIIGDFSNAIKNIAYATPKIPVVSNITTSPEREAISNPEYWCKHILSEVRFHDSVSNLSKMGSTLFVEIGAKTVLCNFVRDLDGCNAISAAISSDRKAGQQLDELIASLYINGCNIDWCNYYPERTVIPFGIPNYVFHETHSSLGNHAVVNRIDDFNEANETSSEIGSDEQSDVIPDRDSISKYLKNVIYKNTHLDMDCIQENENLIVYGLDSIFLIKMADEIQSHFGIKLNIGAMMKHCSIECWSLQILEILNGNHDTEHVEQSFALDTAGRYTPFALNEVQMAYCVGRNEDMELGGNACYSYFEIDLEELDVERFKRAVEKLVERHDMLRDVISPEGVQCVSKKCNLPFEYEDITGTDAEEKFLENKRIKMQSSVIPLGEPMFDISITKHRNGYRIHFGIDFMICDAKSIMTLWNDLSRLYAGEELPAIEVTYRDYLRYREEKKASAKYEEDIQYWQEKAENFPPAPSLPVKYNSNMELNGGFKRRRKLIPLALWKKFMANASKRGITPSAALCSLYCEVLSLWGNASDFGIVLTVFERDHIHPQVEEIVGDFTELILIDVERRQVSIAENAQNLQEKIHSGIDHALYSAVDLIKEINKLNKHENRIYPVVFTSTLGVEMADGRITSNNFYDHLGYSSSSTPQVWLDHQVYFEKDGLVLSWDMLDCIFEGDTADVMFDAYANLVMRAAEDDEFWDNPVYDMRPDVQKQEQSKANDTAKALPEHLMHEAFLKAAESYPDHVAVVFDSQSYTYAQLKDFALRTAQVLKENGAVVGDMITVQMRKSFEQIGAILGVLIAGGAYVPLQYSNPCERTESIMERAGSSLILTNKPLEMNRACIQIIADDIYDTEPMDDTYEKIDGSNIAYVIFTSGSTGEAKGVCISHKAAMNTIDAVNALLNVTEKDRAIGISAVSFDLSVYDIFGLLTSGGCLVIPTEEQRFDPLALYKLCKENHVTIWNTVPALMESYADGLKKMGYKDNTIRSVILSGDWISIDLPEKLEECIPQAELISMGGATEASIWSNYYRVSKGERFESSIPYGYPLANQQFYILDSFSNICPKYTEGKLYIAGAGLSNGYLNAPDLTAAAFTFNEKLGIRLYETGDYGRYLDNGCIQFLGRKDNQVKIHGFRVELGEIEKNLLKQPYVADAAAVFHKGEKGQQKIYAYYTPPEQKLHHDKEMAEAAFAAAERAAANYNNSVVSPDEYSGITELLEKMSLCIMLNTFTELCGDSNELSVEQLIQSRKVMPKYKKLMYQWADSLVKYGYFDKIGSMYHKVRDFEKNDNKKYLEEAKKYPHIGSWEGSLEFLLQSEEHMTGILQAEVDPLTILFPEGNIDRAENFYRYNPVAEYNNNMIAAAVAAYADSNHGETIKVLEFGAGTGGTTAEVLKKLKGKKFEYIFTDLSSFFFKKAEESFGSDVPLKYGIYNIDDYPVIQGYPYESYDIIIGANVLHDTKYLDKTIGYMYSMLKKDGMLMILELTKNKLFHKVSIGLIEGFSGYADDRVIQNEPLISAEQWKERMDRCGFSKIEYFPSENSEASAFEQNVVLAYAGRNTEYTNSNVISEELKKGLPSYMIPSGIYPLEKLPLTVNGKIDKASLPIPTDKAEETEYIAPTNSLEELVQKVVCDILEQEKISVETDLFECGCDSLKAIQIVSSLGAEGYTISLKSIYETPTIRGIAWNLTEDTEGEQKESASDYALPAKMTREKFPLNSIQAAYLMGRSTDYDLGNISCHYYVELETELDIQRFETALNQVIKHQPSLRTIVHQDGYQQVLDDTPYYNIEVTDMSSLPKAVQNMRIREYRNKVSHTMFEMGKWPLFRFKAMKIGEGKHILFADIDVMIADAGSFFIFGDEIMTYYNDVSAKPEPFDFEFSDYLRSLENFKTSEKYQNDRKYWMDRIDGFPMPPTLPVSADISMIKKPHFRRLTRKFEREEYNVFKNIAAEHQITPAVMLCCAYCNVLALYCDKQEFLMNLTMFNRYPFYEKVNDIMGDFTSTIILDAQVNSAKTFWEQCVVMQKRFGEDIEHRCFDGIDFLKELSKKNNHTPFLVPAVFTCAIFGDGVKGWNDIGSIRYALSQTSQVLLDNQITVLENELTVVWDFVDNAFDTSIIEEMYDTYISMIRDICSGNAYINCFPEKSNQILKEINAQSDTEIGICDKCLPELKDSERIVLSLSGINHLICSEDKKRVFVNSSEAKNITAFGELLAKARETAFQKDDAVTDDTCIMIGSCNQIIASLNDKEWPGIEVVFVYDDVLTSDFVTKVRELCPMADIISLICDHDLPVLYDIISVFDSGKMGGRPINGFEVSVMNHSGATTPANIEGVLVYRTADDEEWINTEKQAVYTSDGKIYIK